MDDFIEENEDNVERYNLQVDVIVNCVEEVRKETDIEQLMADAHDDFVSDDEEWI